MSESRKKLKFLLLEARLDQEMVEHEKDCLVRSGQLDPDQFVIVDMVKTLPTLDLLDGVDAVFVGGTGDYSIAKDRPPFIPPLEELTRAVLDRGIPFMGLCYGFHLMAQAVGGKVVRDPAHGESGTFEVTLSEEGRREPILSELPPSFLAQQGHNDVVMEVPAPFVWLASSERCHWQALRHPEKPFYGFQFHPELGRDDFMLRMRKYAHEYASTPERFKEIDDQVKETKLQSVIRLFVDLVVVPHSEKAQLGN
ncbi:unnamed protein product [Phaeothamnion confervicola]